MQSLVCTMALLSSAAIPAATESLTAVLSPGPRPNTVAVEYRNNTAKEVAVSEQVLITNCLALEVTDRAGRVMSPIPPSPPWSHDGGVRIPAGGVRREVYTLDQFSPTLPPGRYRVRVRLDGWTCEPLNYEVSAGK